MQHFTNHIVLLYEYCRKWLTSKISLMSFQLKAKHWLVAIVPTGIAITAIAWQNSGAGNNNNFYDPQDTVPAKHRQKSMRNEDTNQKDIDREMRKLDDALNTIDTKVDKINWEEIQKQVQSSMEKANEEMKNHQVDMEQIQKQIDESIKNIDFDKIKEETAIALQHVKEDIDINKINAEVQRALTEARKEINNDEIRKSIDEAKKVNMDEVKKAIEEAKNEMEKDKVNMKEEMGKAKQEIKKAKDELKGYKRMLDDMEKEGLINTNQDYSVEYKDGELFINGQKQSQDLEKKYKDYFKKDNIKIYKKNGEFNITNDD